MRLKIREARRRAGLTQVALAAAAGIDRSRISRMERGLAPVKVDQLAAIADALNVRAADLLDDSHDTAAGLDSTTDRRA